MVSSTKETAERIENYLRPITKKHNLTLDGFDHHATDRELSYSSTVGTLRLSGGRNSPWLDPSPITPTDEAPYALLSGTIRQSWSARARTLGDAKDRPIFVVPALMGGQFKYSSERIDSLRGFGICACVIFL